MKFGVGGPMSAAANHYAADLPGPSSPTNDGTVEAMIEVVADLGAPRESSSSEISPLEFRARWRQASLEGGWNYPSDWWVPAIDAITEAGVRGDDVAPGFTRIGRARAAAGVPMDETLADVEAFCSVVDVLASATDIALAQRTLNHAGLMQATAIGWAEGVGSHEFLMGEDPLTRLVRPAYLAIRLGEVYREASARGEQTGRSHALVVVSLLNAAQDEQDDRVASAQSFSETVARPHQMTFIADTLHCVFSAGQTLAALSPTTAVALVRRDRELAVRINLLRDMIEQYRVRHVTQPNFAAGVWLEGLPTSLHNAVSLLAELRR